MKAKLTALAGLVALIGLTYYMGTAHGQPKAAASAEPAEPSKVALIDMAEVFREYEKFKVLRNDLQDKIKGKDEEIQLTVKKMQSLQGKLQGKEIAKGSPEYNELEKQYVQLGSELESSRKQAQLELMREEAKNYHTIYLEAQGAVKQFAKHFGYTIVMRFNKDELDSNDPQKVIQGLGRQIVYHDPQDDITRGVIEYLNRNYKGPRASAGNKNAGEVQPVGAEQRPKTANKPPRN